MIKKLLALSFLISLTACSNDNNLTQPVIDQQINNNVEANSLLGQSLKDGTATFTGTKSNGEKYLTTKAFSVDLRVRRLGVQVGKFNSSILSMPSKSISGYSYISNDGNLYLNVYNTKDHYKIGTWSVKDKFKGKGYINLNAEIPESLYFQKFDIKLDSSISNIKAVVPLNPMADRSLTLTSKVDVQPVTKSEADFDLSKFIATK